MSEVKEEEKEKAVNIDDAKKMIIEERKGRENACISEIREVCKKHNCSILIEGFFSGDRFQSGLKVVSN